MLIQDCRHPRRPPYRSLRKEAPSLAGWYACVILAERRHVDDNGIGMMDADEKYFKEHGEPLFSSHMIDLSEEEVDWNIQTTAKYLKRAAPMKQWLEMVGEELV